MAPKSTERIRKMKAQLKENLKIVAKYTDDPLSKDALDITSAILTLFFKLSAASNIP
jgi:hypothetical protein